MECCPPPDRNGLNAVFRGRYVRHEADRFRRRGLGDRQAYMLDRLEPEGARVLDLGAGVGAVALSALRRGAVSAWLVEVSRDSLDAARVLARESGVADRARFLLADAVDLPAHVRGDAVVLDRVVCCHPDAGAILRRAAAASAETLVFSFPAPTWWMRSFRGIANAAFAVAGRSYRFYLHDARELLAAAGAAGHEPCEERRFGVWRVVVLRRAGGRRAPPPGGRLRVQTSSR